MKKKLLFCAVFLLAVVLSAGCGNSGPQQSPPETSSQAASVTGPSYSPPESDPAEAPVYTPVSSPGPLTLHVTEPADAATIQSGTVTVKGRTAPGATVIVNEELGEADAEGNFSIAVGLVEGPNAIIVQAFDDEGNEAEVILMINMKN